MAEWAKLSSDERRRVRRAVNRGRKVDDPSLAPAAVELAQRYQTQPYRTVVPMAIAGGLAFLAARVITWAAFGSSEQWPQPLVMGIIGAGTIAAVYSLIYPRVLRSRARQAEGRNAKAVDSS